MIQLQGAGKRFGHKLLFEDCDWLITPRERTGLVGGNGTGKSTLLKILCGMETLDYGSVSFTKGMTIGYLPQDGLTLTGRTVFAEAMSVFDQLGRWRKSSKSCTTAWANWTPRVPNTPRRRIAPITLTASSESRWLRDRGAGRHGARRAGVPQGRLGAAHRGIFGRLADAPGAGEAAARKAEPAVAR